MIDKRIVDEINEKTDIVKLIGDYVNLTKKGKNYVGLCPFHDDKNPSLSVSPEKNIYKCFSCGEGGNPIKFYQKINHTTYVDAVLALAEPLGIKLDFKREIKDPTLKEHGCLNEAKIFYEYYLHNSKTGESALAYLAERGLSKEAINHFHLGLSPKEDAVYPLLKEKGYADEEILNSGLVNKKVNRFIDMFNYRIMFPVLDMQGRVIAFSGRALEKAEPKYINSPETVIFNKSEVLYHLYEGLGEIKRANSVIIYEGFFDCISSYQAGIKNVVATMGTALTLYQARVLADIVEHVIIAYDGDQAGIEATLKAINVLKKTRLRVDVLAFDEKTDPDDYIKKYGEAKFLELFKSNIKDSYSFIYDLTKKDLDLTNANDIALLKSSVRKMLYQASPAIKELYLKKLSDDIKVSKASLADVLSRPVYEPREKVKEKKKTLPLRYYKAEELLFINMIKDKTKAKRIEQALGSKYVCDINMFRLRSVLSFNYYTLYETFDELIFKELLKKEPESQKLIERLDLLLNSIEYEKPEKFTFTDESITTLIDRLKEINDYKEYKKIQASIKQENESFQKAQLITEQTELKRRLTKK